MFWACQFSLFCNEWTEWKDLVSCASWQMLQKDITLLLSSAVPKQPFGSRKGWYVLLIRSAFIWIYCITSQCHAQWNSGHKDTTVLHSKVPVAPRCLSQLPVPGKGQQHHPLRLLLPEEMDKQSPSAKEKGRSRCWRSSMKIYLAYEEHNCR